MFPKFVISKRWWRCHQITPLKERENDKICATKANGRKNFELVGHVTGHWTTRKRKWDNTKKGTARKKGKIVFSFLPILAVPRNRDFSVRLTTEKKWSISPITQQHAHFVISGFIPNLPARPPTADQTAGRNSGNWERTRGKTSNTRVENCYKIPQY